MWFWPKRISTPQQRIAAEGGIDTFAQIIGGSDSSIDEEYTLIYEYTDAWVEGNSTAAILAKIAHPDLRAEAFRRILHGTWGQRYTGEISTGWDIYHWTVAGHPLPTWMHRYHSGYRFPIRFLRRDPQVHYCLELFDFTQ
jgi:hypothetical protein